MRIKWMIVTLLLAGCGSAAPPGSHTVTTTLDRDPAKPVAVVTGSQPGTTLGLISLRRSGPKVVTAKVRVSARDAPDDVRLTFGQDILHDSVDGMHLIDEVNGRDHFVLEDQNGDCLCSAIDGLEAGQQADLYAKFPAPPAGVTRVSLHVPNFPSFDGIRIDP